MYERIPQLTEEQIITAMSKSGAETYFSKLLEKIPEELALKMEDEIWEKIDGDELTIQQACLETLAFIKKREGAINSFGIENTESIDRSTLEQRDLFIQSINLSRLDPSCYLGEGAVAEVYSIMNENKKLCVKIIIDYTRYTKENNIHQEARFLERLHGFEKDGVRTPALKNKISQIGFDALVMEELDAVTVESVVRGQCNLPENFDMENFFKRLISYIKTIQTEKGIYHLDIAARNIMIDKNTGLPYLIDFGKSKFKDDFMGEKSGNFESIYEGKDSAGLAAIKAGLKGWFEGGRKPLTKINF